MSNERWAYCGNAVVFVLFVLGACWGLALLAKGCRAEDKSEKMLELVKSIEKKVEERDSTLSNVCDALLYAFQKEPLFDENGERYKGKPLYNAEGDSVGTIEEMAARSLDVIKDRMNNDCYEEIDELKQILNEE